MPQLRCIDLRRRQRKLPVRGPDLHRPRLRMRSPLMKSRHHGLALLALALGLGALHAEPGPETSASSVSQIPTDYLGRPFDDAAYRAEEKREADTPKLPYHAYAPVWVAWDAETAISRLRPCLGGLGRQDSGRYGLGGQGRATCLHPARRRRRRRETGDSLSRRAQQLSLRRVWLAVGQAS